MTCTIAWQGRRAVKTFTGFVSAVEFIRSAENISADARFDDLQVVFNDFLRVTAHGVDVDAYARVAICRLGAMGTNPNYRVAFLALGQIAKDLEAAIEPSMHWTPFFPVVCGSMAAAEGWYARQERLNAPRLR